MNTEMINVTWDKIKNDFNENNWDEPLLASLWSDANVARMMQERRGTYANEYMLVPGHIDINGRQRDRMEFTYVFHYEGMRMGYDYLNPRQYVKDQILGRASGARMLINDVSTELNIDRVSMSIRVRGRLETGITDEDLRRYNYDFIRDMMII